eukprot:3854662-Pyramimonas_sp.AAC.1
MVAIHARLRNAVGVLPVGKVGCALPFEMDLAALSYESEQAMRPRPIPRPACMGGTFALR